MVLIRAAVFDECSGIIYSLCGNGARNMIAHGEAWLLVAGFWLLLERLSYQKTLIYTYSSDGTGLTGTPFVWDSIHMSAGWYRPDMIGDNCQAEAKHSTHIPMYLKAAASARNPKR